MPEEVVENVLGTLDQLTETLSDFVEGEPLDLGELAALLPENMLEQLSADPAMAPLVLVNVLQQSVLSIVSELGDFAARGEGTAELPQLQTQPLNLGALISAIAKFQQIAQPASPGQHPVAIAAKLGQGEGANPAPIEIAPEELDLDVRTLAQTLQVVDKPAKDGKITLPFTEFFQQVAAVASQAPGVIDIPKDMVQVIPDEVALTVQAAQETQGNAPQVQQAARPDAPQAKFTQAVIGQLRSAEFKEGVTKVELNPRGLGNVEIELKTNVDGSLSVVVRAESAHVLNSLRQESDLLAQVIAQGGEASVDFQEFSSGDQQSFEQQDALTGGGVSDGGGEEGEEATSDQVTIGNGQLDLMT